MTQREKIEDMLKTIYYKGKDGKGYSEYEISDDADQIETLITEGKIEEVNGAEIWQDKGLVFISTDSFGNKVWVNRADRIATLQASLKGKEDA